MAEKLRIVGFKMGEMGFERRETPVNTTWFGDDTL